MRLRITARPVTTWTLRHVQQRDTLPRAHRSRLVSLVSKLAQHARHHSLHTRAVVLDKALYLKKCAAEAVLSRHACEQGVRQVERSI